MADGSIRPPRSVGHNSAPQPAYDGRPSAIHSATDRYSNLEINYLLQRLETFEGVAAMTTNLASEIDPSFRRRISCTLTLPLPDVEAREQIWRNHLPG